LLREHRAQTAPAQDETQRATDHGDKDVAQDSAPRLNGHADGGPGALTRDESRAPSTVPVVV
jgi:hypothetical protein